MQQYLFVNNIFKKNLFFLPQTDSFLKLCNFCLLFFNGNNVRLLQIDRLAKHESMEFLRKSVINEK